jgi:hypothetical protein
MDQRLAPSLDGSHVPAFHARLLDRDNITGLRDAARHFGFGILLAGGTASVSRSGFQECRCLTDWVPLFTATSTPWTLARCPDAVENLSGSVTAREYASGGQTEAAHLSGSLAQSLIPPVLNLPVTYR